METEPGKLAYTVSEAAEAIGLSKSTVFEMLKDGRLRGLKLGHRRLIRRSELEAVLDAAEAQTARAA